MDFKKFVLDRFSYLNIKDYEEAKYGILSNPNWLVSVICDFLDPNPEPNAPDNSMNRDWNSEFKSKKGFHVFYGWGGEGRGFLRDGYADFDCNLASNFIREMNHKGWHVETRSYQDTMWSCRAWRVSGEEFSYEKKHSRIDAVVQVIKDILEKEAS